MDRDILKGLKFGFGVFLFFSIFFGVVWAVGFHSADEILNGTFLGNYTFTGNVDFSSANIVGVGMDTLYTSFPDVIVCTDSSMTRYFYISVAPSSDDKVLYRALMNSAGDYYMKFSMDGTYYSGTGVSGYDCVGMSISELYDADKAFNLMGGLGSTPSGAVMSFNLNTCPVGWKPCDGSDGTVDLRGQFIRGLNDFGTGVRSDGLEDPDGSGRTLGSWQNESFLSHSHGIGIYPSLTSGSNYGTRHSGSLVSTYQTDKEGDNETRPRNVALIYCQKE